MSSVEDCVPAMQSIDPKVDTLSLISILFISVVERKVKFYFAGIKRDCRLRYSPDPHEITHSGCEAVQN